MSSPTLTLDDAPVTRATVTAPSVGAWTADVWLADAVALTGSVTLAIGALLLSGTIVRGGVYAGGAAYRLVGGAGGWRRAIGAKIYRDLGTGVRLSTIIKDAASDVGETVVLTAAADRVVGPSYVRRAGEASRALRELAASVWYVDWAGVTQLGARPASAPDEQAYTVVSYRPEAGIVVLATERPEAFAPGCTLPLIGLVSLLRIQADGTSIKVEGWALDDVGGGLGPLLRSQSPLLDWHGLYEYTVVGQDGEAFDLTPTSTALGLPDLPGFRPRPGAPGSGGDLEPGSTVLVGFVNGDPARPFIAFYDGGVLPLVARLDAQDDVELANAQGRVLRDGELVTIAGVQAGVGVAAVLISLAPANVAPGAPGTGYSKVKA